MQKDKMSFLERKQHEIAILGFWDEEYRETIINLIESGYNTTVIREYYISNLIDNDKKILLKWEKRLAPLTDEQLLKKYGRTE